MTRNRPDGPAHLRACIVLEDHGFDGEKIIALLKVAGFRIVPKYLHSTKAEEAHRLENLLLGITEENRHEEIGT